ncbi:MAG: DUF938 domain-containing protein [Gammaproteobacteria bacterium]|nr:DUF938 domain-containing protein [Gammaproteobacteria bacterium]
MIDKIENQACLRNQEPIYQALKPWLISGGSLVELASGTGQHGVYIAKRLPKLDWQLTEHPDNLLLSQPWFQDAVLPNLKPPQALNIDDAPWSLPLTSFDFAYCANLLHFVSTQTVSHLFSGVSAVLKPKGLVFCYGPINEDGYTSEGNASLDNWLRTEVNPHAGIKELNWLIDQAENEALVFKQRLNLPANNVILVFEKGHH